MRSLRAGPRLPEIYVVLALAIAVPLCALTAPFFAPDEANQVCRALSVADGRIVLPPSATEPGAPIDANVFRVMDGVNDIRMAWERSSGDFHDRRYGAVDEAGQLNLSGIRWAHAAVFVPFGNTAVYPPLLYLPAILGLRLGEFADLTIFRSLQLARLFCALSAIALGWLALRLCACSRWLLFAFLLLPSVLFLNAGVSQDAILLPIAALIAAILTRPLTAARDFTLAELLALAPLLALCGTARPPYLALAAILFLPRVEGRGLEWRHWRAPVAACLAVVAICGVWRQLVLPLGLDTADAANPDLQQQFLRTHPLAAALALCRGTADAAWDLFHRGLYVVGWNDLLPHHGAALLLSLCLGLLALGSEACPIRTWRGRWLLLCAVAAPLLGISFAEYIIWTPPGLATVYGIQPRYWLPVLPFAALLFAGRVPSPERAKAWLLPSAATLLALVSCTLPWMVSQAFYRDTVRHVLELNLR